MRFMFLPALAVLAFFMTGTVHAETPVTEEKTHVFNCGDTLVYFTVGPDDERAGMRIANVSYAMERVVSASGARYRNLGDDRTVFWNKGDKAWVTIDGKSLPDCQETAMPAKPERPYHAQGNEPGWHFVLENDTMTLNLQDGGKVAAPVTARSDDAGAKTISGKTHSGVLTVVTKPQRCVDTMSGEKFADTVSVSYRGSEYRGCGRSLIRGVPWLLEDLNGKGVIDRVRVTLLFDAEGRMYGRGGCNRYNGGYTLEGERLSISPNVAATMMACVAPAVMEQEHAYFQSLPKMTHATVDGTGILLLKGEAGESMRFSETDED